MAIISAILITLLVGLALSWWQQELLLFQKLYKSGLCVKANTDGFLFKLTISKSGKSTDFIGETLKQALIAADEYYKKNEDKFKDETKLPIAD